MAESLFIPPGYECWSLVWFFLIVMNSVFTLHVREKVHFIQLGLVNMTLCMFDGMLVVAPHFHLPLADKPTDDFS